jgi:DHA2 family methylenomycin A resistance protein-like MFS transporter
LVTPRLAARFGSRLPILTGQLLMAGGLLGIAAAVGGAPLWALELLMIPVGLGQSLAVPSLTALLVTSVPADRTGIASGVLNTSRQLGGAIAVALFGSLLARETTFVHGMQLCLLLAGGLQLAGSWLSSRLPRASGRLCSKLAPRPAELGPTPTATSTVQPAAVAAQARSAA